jgi:CPA2 family monovalent cation:H+ antiporter-2
MIFASANQDVSLIFIEMGAAVIGLAVLARLASRWGFSAIPLYLIAGLAFGNGGIAPLNFSESFIGFAGEVGVLLLLFMLGLEYTGEELIANLRLGLPAGLMDFALNFAPGLIAGLMLGWKPLAALLLAGVTYISSSGVIAKVLGELGWMSNKETPIVLSVLVIEDLAMAVYLPLIAVLLIGQSFVAGLISILIALATVGVVLFLAVRYGALISRFAAHESNEIILLTTFGAVLLVAGIAQRLQVSAAVGAFLVGIALSGPLVERAHNLISPLRDLFAAQFFFFFGLQIDPATLPPVLLLALVLGIVTTLTKMLTGWWSARRAGIERKGRWRAGAVLVSRGEFSIVIAELGVQAGLESRLGPLSAAYVLFLAVLGPILARAIEPLLDAITRKRATG